MDRDDWFTLEELAGRLGSLIWVERRVSDLLAEWASIESHAPSAVLFSITGRHHQWHAQVISQCIPTSPQLGESALVVAPTTGWHDALSTLRDLNHPQATASRLRALGKVVDPWLERETTALLDLSRPISEAAMMRWLRFTILDHQHDGDASSHLLAGRSHDTVRLDEHIALNHIDLGTTEQI